MAHTEEGAMTSTAYGICGPGAWGLCTSVLDRQPCHPLAGLGLEGQYPGVVSRHLDTWHHRNPDRRLTMALRPAAHQLQNTDSKEVPPPLTFCLIFSASCWPGGPWMPLTVPTQGELLSPARTLGRSAINMGPIFLRLKNKLISGHVCKTAEF